MKENRNTLPMHYEREGERSERECVVCNICTYKFQVKYLIFLQTI